MSIRIEDRDLVDLRFPVGTRVECLVGRRDLWMAGTVVGHFYVQSRIPEGMCVPYLVDLDNGRRIFAPCDDDRVIRRIQENTEMHDAVTRGDVTTMKRLLEEDTEMSFLSTLDANGQTVMHKAVDLAVSKAAAEADAMASVRALLRACKARPGASAITAALCTHSKGDGRTVLHLAASTGSAALMRELLSILPENKEIRRAILNAKTRLEGGLYDGQWGKKKAGNLEKLDTDDKSLLHLAVERLLPDDDDMGLGEPSGEPSEVATRGDAASADVVELVRTIASCGVDVHALDAHGRTVLHLAVGAGLHDVVQLLLEAHADPTTRGKSIGMRNCALHQATLRDDVKMIRLLLDAAIPCACGLDVPDESAYSSSTSDDTAAACGSGSGPGAALDVDSPGQGGWTALALAARSGYKAAAKALLEGGADPTAVMANGKSALDIARVNKKVGVVALLEKWDASSEELAQEPSVASPFAAFRKRRVARPPSVAGAA